MNHSKYLPLVFVAALGSMSGEGQIFVADLAIPTFTSTIGEYTTSGAVINSSLVTGLPNPGAMAFDRLGHLFIVVNSGVVSSRIAEYTTSGALLNAFGEFGPFGSNKGAEVEMQPSRSLHATAAAPRS